MNELLDGKYFKLNIGFRYTVKILSQVSKNLNAR